MRWVKAGLVLAISAVLGWTTYGMLDNIAVPSALVLIGVILACMAVALDGDSGATPPPNPRARAGAAPQSDAHLQAQAARAPQGNPEWPQRENPDAAAWRTGARNP